MHGLSTQHLCGSSIHKKDKGSATDTRVDEKLMDETHHRRDRHSNGNNDERNRGSVSKKVWEGINIYFLT